MPLLLEGGHAHGNPEALNESTELIEPVARQETETGGAPRTGLLGKSG